jgi:hypothetical protein
MALARRPSLHFRNGRSACSLAMPWLRGSMSSPNPPVPSRANQVRGAVRGATTRLHRTPNWRCEGYVVRRDPPPAVPLAFHCRERMHPMCVELQNCAICVYVDPHASVHSNRIPRPGVAVVMASASKSPPSSRLQLTSGQIGFGVQRSPMATTLVVNVSFRYGRTSPTLSSESATATYPLRAYRASNIVGSLSHDEAR